MKTGRVDRPMHPALPVCAAASAGILVGAAMVATRFVIAETDPIALALLRYAIGTLCLLPPVVVAGRVRFARRDLLPIALLGIGQFGILIALLNFGLQFVGAALGALIFATFPLLTMLIAAALRAEALTRLKSAGVLLSLLGVGLALGDRLSLPESGPQQWTGVLAILASALTGAACAVLYRPYLGRYPPLQVSAFAMAAAVLFLAVLAAFAGFYEVLPRFSPGGWGAVVFIGTSSGLGYYLWIWALKHETPTRVTVFLALSPVTATGLGGLLLGEPVTGLFLLGLVCVTGGLWLAHRPARPPVRVALP